MQNFRNYFELLGVAQGAPLDEVKQAYRQMARKYHPDLNPGDKAAEEQFKLLGEAYEVLSDPEKRAQYEEYSRFWQQKGFPRPGSSRSGSFSLDKINFGDFGDFNTFVDQLLNRRRDTPRPGRDQPPAPVPEMGRAAAANDPYRPADSRTSSRASTRPRGPSRPPARSTSRRDAEANLTLPLEKAYTGGQERIRLEDGRSLEVDMPMGMVTGQRIRLKGQGMGGGNLYLRIEVEPHPLFELQGDDIFCRVPVTPSEAALGGPIEVPTLDGPVQMTIPAGVQTGRRLRLAGKGYPVNRDRRGDQVVELVVTVPSELSDRERALYSELRETETFKPRHTLL
ncbi:DnaJ C-terminal domain-containing protein [Leptolyngbya sp. PCC 6406]|uniref:DnaJ C-terminal domain-containing protein n=1 Tax=Leptolyngbya sp. PCC 6406 TaxID=1173264 RepID=UPI0002ABF077|nr:J domain-containing protein [Leptolyngbya sp. PCC 6406]